MPKAQMSVNTINVLWPEAINIRYEGRCDICHRHTLFTFQLPEDHAVNRGINSEQCGYWCAGCGWSNAGARDKEIP